METTFDLKSIRKSRNMKQEELAAAVGVSGSRERPISKRMFKN